MKKWQALLYFAFLVSLVYGCGQANPGSPAAEVVPTSVTFTGAAAASSSDLAKLGATTLGIESKEDEIKATAALQAKGFDAQSISALKLVPMAASGTTVTLNKVNNDGSYTAVDTESIAADGTGTYTLSDEAYNPNNTYVIKTTKLSSTAGGKELNMETIVDSKAANGATTGSVESINSSPQTTLLMQIIKDKVITALGTATIEPEVVNLIKNLVISRINSLITHEGMSLTTVKAATASENESMKDAVTQSFSDSVVQKAIDAIKFKAAIVKGAKDLDTAKKVMKELFTNITGSPTGVPGSITDAFAQSYRDGVTKTIAQLAAASDKCVSKNGVVVTGVFTAANVAEAIRNKITATYQSASGVTSSSSQYELKAQDPIIQAAFPASVWANKTIDGNTVLNVPQIVILIEVGNAIANAGGYEFNPPKVAMELGLMTGLTDKFEIMHSELRVESWEDWQNFHPETPGTRPDVYAVLTSFVDVGNMVNPTVDTSKLAATLTYLKADGTSATANYQTMSGGFGDKSAVSANNIVRKKEMGKPQGFVNFQIAPWGNQTPIKDFKLGSTATLTIKNDGAAIATRDLTISSVNLTSALIAFKSPYPEIWSGEHPLITIFQEGSKPLCEWSFGTIGGAKEINFGTLKCAYAIEVREVDPVTNQPKFSSAAVYSTWHNQDFSEGEEGQATKFMIPSVMTAGTYTIMGAVVGLDASGWPIVSGPWKSTLFKVGTAGTIASKVVTIEGTVTPPASPQAGKAIRVGLFRMLPDTDLFNTSVTPVYVGTPLGNYTYSMTISYGDLTTRGNGGYDTIAWEDDGDEVLEGAAGERPYFPSKHMGYWNGMLNAMDSNFNPLGPVNASQNTTGYNIDMSLQFWGPAP